MSVIKYQTYSIYLSLCNLLSPFVTNIQIQHIDWHEIINLANRTYLIPALYNSLVNKGILSFCDPQLIAYLESVYQLNFERNQLLLQQINEIALVCNRIGIEPVLLKGAASLVENHYINSGARFMLDLDILVPPERLNDVIAAVTAIGYFIPESYQNENFNNLHHAAPMKKIDGVGNIELHRRIINDALLNQALLNQIASTAITLNHGGRVRLLSPAGQILHGIIHSEVQHGNYYFYNLNLRQLHHFITLSHYHKTAIEWHKIAEFMKKYNYQRILNYYLYSAWKLFSGPINILAGLFTFGAINLGCRYTINDKQSLWYIRWKHLIYLLNRYSKL